MFQCEWRKIDKISMKLITLIILISSQFLVFPGFRFIVESASRLYGQPVVVEFAKEINSNNKKRKIELHLSIGSPTFGTTLCVNLKLFLKKGKNIVPYKTSIFALE